MPIDNNLTVPSVSRSRVGVIPEHALATRARLFAALEQAFPVRFSGCRPGEWKGLAGVIGVGADCVPELTTSGLPSFCSSDRPDPADSAGRVSFRREPAVDARLAGRVLWHRATGGSRPPVASYPSVLAVGPRGPVWTASSDGRATWSAGSLQELARGERLKDRMRQGWFMPFVPLVEFLRKVTGADRWARPSLRACLLLDDPNLHWASYGYVRYDALFRQASIRGFRAAVATVPLDAFVAARSALRYFQSGSPLSLLIHGNDHSKRELARAMTLPVAVALAAQAWQRVSRFEARYGVEIGRVMVPPHDDYRPAAEGQCHPRAGACSQLMLQALKLTGFEGICYYGPSDGDDPLVGWCPADVYLAGSLPGLHRLPLEAPIDELVLRAFLGQPVILFGHHGNLANPDALTEAADRVATLGDVQWMQPQDLVRTNYLTRADDQTLVVEAYGRRVEGTIPDGISRVSVTLGSGRPSHRHTVTVRSAGAGSVSGSSAEPLEVQPGGRFMITIDDPRRIDPMVVDAASRRLWPVVRRGLTEGRDRLAPILRFGSRSTAQQRTVADPSQPSALSGSSAGDPAGQNLR